MTQIPQVHIFGSHVFTIHCTYSTRLFRILFLYKIFVFITSNLLISVKIHIFSPDMQNYAHLLLFLQLFVSLLHLNLIHYHKK